MLNAWVFADDVNDFNFKCTMYKKYPADAEYVMEHLTVEFNNAPLKTLINKSGTPDVVLIDCSSISLLNDQDLGFNVLEAFANNHSSSIIVITSMCHPLAKQTMDDLKERIQDEVVVEDLGGGPEWATRYLRDKVLQYYPR